MQHGKPCIVACTRKPEPRERQAGLDLVECHANGRVMAQSVVVIEILVAHGNARNTLTNQRLDIMDHQVRLAGINETPGQPRYQAAAASTASGHLTSELA